MSDRPGERLIEDFGELSMGMRVVVRTCDNCGQVHRGMLLEFVRRVPVVDCRGVELRVDAWEMVPAPACVSMLNNGRAAVTKDAVIRRTLYEQVDQTPEEKRWERRIKRPKPRSKFRAPVLADLEVTIPGGLKFKPR